mmetsp:Transcript_21232/g.48632  ORF Transcript_21232/g.48632 Transcript_21232/m.48632 type:complete len:125 (-) Transcript_21232:91-465(-)
MHNSTLMAAMRTFTLEPYVFHASLFRGQASNSKTELQLRRRSIDGQNGMIPHSLLLAQRSRSSEPWHIEDGFEWLVFISDDLQNVVILRSSSDRELIKGKVEVFRLEQTLLRYSSTHEEPQPSC